jgi:microcompartment protein CcmL/EutN
MSIPQSIGAVELSSVGIGYKVQDAMLKAAAVELLLARTICSGKYIIVVGGTVSDVKTAIETGTRVSGEAVIDQLIIPNVHPSLFPALGQSVVLDPDEVEALGIVETFSGVSAIIGADAAAKAARVTVFRIHVAMALGGKGFCLMTGTIADVRTGVAAAAAKARERGLLVSEVVIPRPRKELLQEYI